jgi:hypothetical protein
VILDRWRDTSIYRSRRLRIFVATTFNDQGTTILTEYMPGGNHVHIGMILVVTDTFFGKRECCDLGTLKSGTLLFVRF